MKRHIPRRLEQLEARARKIAKARPQPHTLCSVNVDKRVESIYDIGTGKLTHFDPPRDCAEFEPMI